MPVINFKMERSCKGSHTRIEDFLAALRICQIKIKLQRAILRHRKNTQLPQSALYRARMDALAVGRYPTATPSGKRTSAPTSRRRGAVQVRSGPEANFDFVRLNITRRILARDRTALGLRPTLLAISATGLPADASCRRMASCSGVQGIGRCFIYSPPARSRPGGEWYRAVRRFARDDPELNSGKTWKIIPVAKVFRGCRLCAPVSTRGPPRCANRAIGLT